MAPPTMSPKKLLLPLILLALAVAAPVAAQQQQEYCRDTLAGLMECQGFMHDPAAGAASPSCCAAYEAAFNADPFCLCYIADGTFARAMGMDVDVSRALQIPISCGQAAPPIELCNMQGLVLPPYEPEGMLPPTVLAAAAPEASAPAMQPGGDVAPPSFTTPPPPPTPTSAAGPILPVPVMIIVIAAVIVAMS